MFGGCGKGPPQEGVARIEDMKSAHNTFASNTFTKKTPESESIKELRHPGIPIAEPV